jgi:signal transduction histidine kinase
MVVPLRIRGRTVAVLTLACTGPRPCFGPGEMALADELGRRASLALENARLYREAEEAVHLRDEFLSVASHELRTPLTTLKLVAQLLARPAGVAGRPPAERQAFAQRTFARQLERLTRLVDDLLDVTRLRGGGRTPLDLGEMDLSALVREVADRFGAELEAHGTLLTLTAPEAVVGRWDWGRLDQVVTNMVSNALKYGDGSPIAVAVGLEGARAVLRVSDRGIGIRPEAQARIFERFERAAPKPYAGLGLGLYIARQIVEAHGGTIHVESAPGEGATFTVLLPDARPAAPAPEARSPAEPRAPPP